jgi:glycosyltransferase involved in cell wall biosynthesis
MDATHGRSLRILYAAGPGNVMGTFQHWKEHHDDPTQVNMTLSGMFYDVCHAHGDKAYVIATHPKAGKVQDEDFIVVHRPTPFVERSGLLWHLGQLITAIRLVVSAIWFRADVAVIVCGTCHWFPLRVLPLFGIKVVASLHCVMWRKYRPLGSVPKFIRVLNRKFFTKSVSGVLSMSKDITDQLSEMTRGRHKPVFQFLPTYRASHFQDFRPPQLDKRPFRVFFAGRIERDKGVFDLLTIAKRFKAAGVNDVVFDVCGTGGAFEELKREVEAAGVGDHFLMHGYCNRPVMREKYCESHVVIVPTTTDFIEGFNQVVSEAVLAGRPVITSAVCPAIYYVKDAVVEVPVDDVQAYGDAILALLNDRELYRRKVEACQPLKAQFYDEDLGWGEALNKALAPLRGVTLPAAEPAPQPPVAAQQPPAPAPIAAKASSEMKLQPVGTSKW